jgi:HEAT repeat protein
LGAGVPVLPVLLKLGAGDLHPRLSTLQTLDFSNYMLRPWDALTDALRRIAEADRPFTVSAPRDAPPVIQQAAHGLDSLNAAEREAAIQTLAQMNHPAARDVLAEATHHPVEDVRIAAAKSLAEVKDLRALPGLFEAIRNQRFDKVNSGSLSEFGETAVPALLNSLGDPNEDLDLRQAAAWALGSIGDVNTLPALRGLLRDAHPELRVTGVMALSNFDAAAPWILECLKDENPRVRKTAVDCSKKFALKKVGEADVIAALIGALRDQDGDVRYAAADALKEMGDATAIPALLESLRDGEENVRFRAAGALERCGDTSAVPGLLAAIHDDSRNVRLAGWSALRRIGGATVVEALLAMLRSGETNFRANAAYALGEIGSRDAVPGLIEALTDEEESVRETAATAVGKMRDAGAVPSLIAAVKSEDEEDDVRQAASDALRNIGTPEARAAARVWEREKKRQG